MFGRGNTPKIITKKVACPSLGQEFLIFGGPILESISYFLLVHLLQFSYELFGQLPILTPRSLEAHNV